MTGDYACGEELGGRAPRQVSIHAVAKLAGEWVLEQGSFDCRTGGSASVGFGQASGCWSFPDSHRRAHGRRARTLAHNIGLRCRTTGSCMWQLCTDTPAPLSTFLWSFKAARKAGLTNHGCTAQLVPIMLLPGPPPIGQPKNPGTVSRRLWLGVFTQA